MNTPSFYHYWLATPFTAVLFFIGIVSLFLKVYAEGKDHKIIKHNGLLRFIEREDSFQFTLLVFTIASAVISAINVLFRAIGYFDATDRQKYAHSEIEVLISLILYGTAIIIPLLFIWYTELKAKRTLKKQIKKEFLKLKQLIETQLNQITRYDRYVGLTRIEIMEITNALEMAQTKLQSEYVKRGNFYILKDTLEKIDSIERNYFQDCAKRFQNILQKEKEVYIYLNLHNHKENQHILDLLQTDILTAYISIKNKTERPPNIK